jgi:hypothetical protein
MKILQFFFLFYRCDRDCGNPLRDLLTFDFGIDDFGIDDLKSVISGFTVFA